MVFQSYALFPHMTVLENVAYGPTVQRHAARRRRTRLAHGEARAGRPRRAREARAVGAVRRPAAARRGRARAGARAAGAAVRRAAVEPRRQAAPPRARGDPRAAADAQPHRRLCDARPGGGARGLRPHHRDVERGASRRTARRASSTSSRRACSSPTSSATPTSSTANSSRSAASAHWCGSATLDLDLPRRGARKGPVKLAVRSESMTLHAALPAVPALRGKDHQGVLSRQAPRIYGRDRARRAVHHRPLRYGLAACRPRGLDHASRTRCRDRAR